MLKSILLLFVLPPLNGLIAVVAGLALRRARAGRGLAIAGVTLLWLTSLPIVADSLICTLERGLTLPDLPAAGTPPPADFPGAIVILGGDGAAIDDGGVSRTDVGPLSLARLRRGARLSRDTGLPILITGGSLGGNGAPIGLIMADVLDHSFGLTARWVESGARDTWENASLSAPMLRDSGVHRVFLVTHGWHMRRALLAFRRAGIAAVPAPTVIDAWPDPREPLSWLPRASAWQRSFYALHEWLGLIWYRHRAG